SGLVHGGPARRGGLVQTGRLSRRPTMDAGPGKRRGSWLILDTRARLLIAALGFFSLRNAPRDPASIGCAAGSTLGHALSPSPPASPAKATIWSFGAISIALSRGARLCVATVAIPQAGSRRMCEGTNTRNYHLRIWPTSSSFAC